MTVPSPPPLEFEEQGQTLRRLFECVSIGRRYAPRLTLSGFQILIYLAIQTLDRTHLDLPTNASLAEAVKLSRSGVSRILESLSSNGRPKFRTDTNHEGYGLIDSNEHIGGLSIYAFVLTSKGRECIVKMMQALTGREIGYYNPHDLNSLFKLIFREIEPKT